MTEKPSIEIPTIGELLEKNGEIANHKNTKFLFHFKDNKTTFKFGNVEWELRMFAFYLTEKEEQSITFGDYVSKFHKLDKSFTLAVVPCGIPIYFWAVNDATGYVNLSIRPII